MIESDYALPQSVIGGGREFVQYDMINNETTNIILDGKSINGKNLDNFENNRQIPTLFSTHNTHDNFYMSEINTISRKVNLFSTNLYLNITTKYLDENDFPLLTPVKFIGNNNADSIDDVMNGTYLLTEKNLFINKKTMTQRIRLNRDSI